MLRTNHLTNPQQDERQRITHPGQANWAEPATDRTCLACEFWGAGDKRLGRDRHGAPTPRRCGKYPQLMDGRLGARVPHDAPACRFFSGLANPPPAQKLRAAVAKPARRP